MKGLGKTTASVRTNLVYTHKPVLREKKKNSLVHRDLKFLFQLF